MRLGFVGICAAVLLSGALGQGVVPTTNAQTPSSVPTGPTHAQTPPSVLTPDDDDDGDDGWRASLSLPCPLATHQVGGSIDRVWGAHRCRGRFFVPRPTVATPTWAVGSHASWPVATSSIPPSWLEDTQEEALPEETSETNAERLAQQDGVHGSIMLSWGSARGIGGIGVCAMAMAIASIGALAALELLDNDDNDDGDGDAAPKGGAYSGESNTPPQPPLVVERGIDGQEDLHPSQQLPVVERDNQSAKGDDQSAEGYGQSVESGNQSAESDNLPDESSDQSEESDDSAEESEDPPDQGDDPPDQGDDPPDEGNDPAHEHNDQSGEGGDPPVTERDNDPHEELNPPQLPPVVERGNDPHEELNPPQLPPATEHDDGPQEELNPPQPPPVVEHNDQRKESGDDRADKPGSNNGDGDGNGNGAASPKESVRPKLLSSDAAAASVGTDAAAASVGSPTTSSTPTPPETPHAGDNNMTRVEVAAQLAGPVPATRAPSLVITTVVASAQPAADSGPGSTRPTRLNRKRKRLTRMPHPKRFNSDVPAERRVTAISSAATILPSPEPVATEPETIGSLLDLVDAARRAARLARPPPSSRDKGKAPVYTPAKTSTRNDSSNAAESRDPPFTGSSRWHERRPARAVSQPDDSSDDEQTYILTRVDKLVIMFSYLSVRDGEKFLGKAHADLQAQLGGGPGPVITSTGSILFGADNIDRLFTFAHDYVTMKSVQQAYAALCTGNRLQFADRARQMLHDIYDMSTTAPSRVDAGAPAQGGDRSNASTPAQGDDSNVSRTHMLGFLDRLPVEDRRQLLHQVMMDIRAPQAASLTTPIPQHATIVDMMSVIYTWSQEERQLFLDEAFARDDAPARDDEAFSSDVPARQATQHTVPMTEASGSSAQGGDNASIDEMLSFAYNLTKDEQARLFTLVLEGEQGPRTRRSTLVDEIAAVVATMSDEDRQQFLSQLLLD
ncbi:hypothetical protein GGI09_000344 [Coemansia sp. S100]|nr:hypothetical protein LPJ71_000661 [Coemansia sp. S17]KAJ2104039.1 hypothetical protein GGI09_000344 [Coemansia sp. S100]KAJ2104912.1 hypothetical protein GGI16_002578 [Coemansia sp. S142-1]